MNAVKENDWKTLPLPDLHEKAILDRILSDNEYERLLLGFRPKDMDDRWFVYVKDSWVYLHRSWTGACIFKVKIVSTGGKHILTEALLNRDVNQYKSTIIEGDLRMINRVIDIVLNS